MTFQPQPNHNTAIDCCYCQHCYFCYCQHYCCWHTVFSTVASSSYLVAGVQIYIISACWGLADGAWYTMIPAHIGAKFLDKPEAAFSAKTLWEAAAAATLFEVGDRLSLKVTN